MENSHDDVTRGQAGGEEATEQSFIWALRYANPFASPQYLWLLEERLALLQQLEAANDPEERNEIEKRIDEIEGRILEEPPGIPWYITD